MKIVCGYLLLVIYSVLVPAVASGQAPGRIPDVSGFDTSYIFTSPRPLISDTLQAKTVTVILGANICLSGNGFGVGFFYHRPVSGVTTLTFDFIISGVRNTDEQESYDPITNTYRVLNKVNRLFLFPTMIGAQFRLFSGSFDESFRPYLAIGAGPAFILTTPYDREFFTAFGHGDTFVKPGGYIGLGADIGTFGRNISGVSFRYYYIPFGVNGLESIRGLPITDFGGPFLTLSVGWAR
jgi:hypothetical protein